MEAQCFRKRWWEEVEDARGKRNLLCRSTFLQHGKLRDGAPIIRCRLRVCRVKRSDLPSRSIIVVFCMNVGIGLDYHLIAAKGILYSSFFIAARYSTTEPRK
jgi:hypothetical protein